MMKCLRKLFPSVISKRRKWKTSNHHMPSCSNESVFVCFSTRGLEMPDVCQNSSVLILWEEKTKMYKYIATHFQQPLFWTLHFRKFFDQALKNKTISSGMNYIIRFKANDVFNSMNYSFHKVNDIINHFFKCILCSNAKITHF